MKNIAAMVWLLGCVFIGCSDKSNPVNNGPRIDLIPLAVGNTWNYKFSAYDTTGNVYLTDTTVTKIVGDTAIANQMWYYQDVQGNYSANLQNGYYTYSRYAQDSLRFGMVYKYPCQPGDKYSYTEVRQCDTLITVPAGTFSCIFYAYRLKTLDSFWYSDAYISPGAGIVKAIGYSFKDDRNHIFLWWVQELLSYHLQ